MKHLIAFLTILLATCNVAFSQIRSAGGTVIDSSTKLPMEYISVYFKNTASGCVTNYRGEFYVQDKSGSDTLVVDAIGYEKLYIKLKPGQNTGLNVRLKPANIELASAIVKPKREKYSKKENPAVELIRKVIANKENNRIESKEYFKSDYHEKLTLSLDDYTPDLEKKKKMTFVQEHIDT